MKTITAKKSLDLMKDMSKFYSYHQIQKDPSHIEFGWIEVDSVSWDGPVVIARDSQNPEWNNATTLEDYKTFFYRLTTLEPSDFVLRWEGSLRELKMFWKSTHPAAPKDQYEFIMKLALLIENGTKFKMYNKNYDIFRIKSGEKNEKSGDKT